MDLLQTLQHLYARELNVSIASDWGNGFTVALGNERNGLTAAKHFDAGELGRAAAWLEKNAAELYPNSSLRGGQHGAETTIRS